LLRMFNFYSNYYVSSITLLGAFAKLWTANASFVMSLFVGSSILLHGTMRLPLEEFSWNLIYEYCSKISRENSSFIKIGLE
jgi:hypothetical protein